MKSLHRILILLISVLIVNQTIAQDFFPVKINKKWGLMDNQGQVHLHPKYDAISEFRKYDYAIIQLEGKVGLINRAGKEIIFPKYEDIRILDSTFIAAMDNGVWMVVGLDGQVILEKGYEQVKVLGRKFLSFKINGKWGLADINGKKISSPLFDNISFLENNYLQTTLDDQQGIINGTGQQILSPTNDGLKIFNQQVFLFKKGKLWGAVDSKGQELFPANFNSFHKISDYFLMLKKKSSVFLFSLNTSKIVGQQGFDKFKDFSTTKVLGIQNKKLALIDQSGEMLLRPQYDEIQFFNQEVFRVRKKGKWGLFTTQDLEVLSLAYDYIAPLKNRPVCTIKKQDKYGLLNLDGEVLTPIEFIRIELEDNMARAYSKSGGLTMFYFDEAGQLKESSKFKKHLKFRFAKSRQQRNWTTAQLEEGNIIGDFEWFYDAAIDRWGLRKLEDGKTKIEPVFDVIDIKRNIGMTLVGIEKFSRYKLDRTEFRLDMLYGLVNNEKGLLVTMLNLWDIRFEDFAKGYPVARCIFDTGRHGLISSIGKIIKKDFAYIGDFKNGLARCSAKGRLSGDIKDRGFALGKVQLFLSKILTGFDMTDYTLYDRAFLEEGVITCEECKWGYVDTSGANIVNMSYDFVKKYKSGVGIVLEKEKWGMLDQLGNTLLPVEYDGIEFLEKTNNQVLRISKNQQKYGLIDTLGHVTVNLRYDNIGAFSDGRLAVKRAGLWGFVDANGQEIIACKFRRVHNFSEGLAVVKLHNKWGVIDKNGQLIIDYKYSRMGQFKNGLAWVHTSKGIGYIDVKEQMRIAPQFNKAFDFNNGIARVVIKGKYGLIGTKGNYILRPNFSQIAAFNKQQLAIVRFSGKKVKYGVIQENGKLITNQKFTKIADFKEGMAAVRYKGKFGFIDTMGQLVVTNIYTKVSNFSEGRAAVQRDGLWGFIDKKGRELIELEYSKCLDFDKGKAIVYKGYQKGGIIDLEGNYIIAPSLNRLLDFSGDRALVRDNNYRFYYITDGMELEDGFYQQAGGFKYGVAVVQLQGRWGIINKKGIEIISPKYDKIEDFKNGYAKVRIKKFSGLTNLKGELIVPAQYEYISYAGNGLFRVEQGDLVGYFDQKGDWVWSMKE